MEVDRDYLPPQRSRAKRAFVDVFIVLFIGMGVAEFVLLFGIWTPAWLVSGGVWVGMIAGVWAAVWMWFDMYKEFAPGVVIIAIITTLLAAASVLGYAGAVAMGWAYVANMCIAIAWIIYLLVIRA